MKKIKVTCNEFNKIYILLLGLIIRVKTGSNVVCMGNMIKRLKISDGENLAIKDCSEIGSDYGMTTWTEDHET
jgi:hypothetical protein